MPRSSIANRPVKGNKSVPGKRKREASPPVAKKRAEKYQPAAAAAAAAAVEEDEEEESKSEDDDLMEVSDDSEPEDPDGISSHDEDEDPIVLLPVSQILHKPKRKEPLSEKALKVLKARKARLATAKHIESAVIRQQSSHKAASAPEIALGPAKAMVQLALFRSAGNDDALPAVRSEVVSLAVQLVNSQMEKLILPDAQARRTVSIPASQFEDERHLVTTRASHIEQALRQYWKLTEANVPGANSVAVFEEIKAPLMAEREARQQRLRGVAQEADKLREAQETLRLLRKRDDEGRLDETGRAELVKLEMEVAVTLRNKAGARMTRCDGACVNAAKEVQDLAETTLPRLRDEKHELEDEDSETLRLLNKAVKKATKEVARLKEQVKEAKEQMQQEEGVDTRKKLGKALDKLRRDRDRAKEALDKAEHKRAAVPKQVAELMFRIERAKAQRVAAEARGEKNKAQSAEFKAEVRKQLAVLKRAREMAAATE